VRRAADASGVFRSARGVAFAALIVSLSCASPLPPPRATPLTAPSAAEAKVIFVWEGPDGWDPASRWANRHRTHIYDDSGALLGELTPQSWFAVSRPPGAQAFVTRPGELCLTTGDLGTGALRAELAGGTTYVVRVVGPYEAPRQRWTRRVCCDGSTNGPSFDTDLVVDLVGVRPDTDAWTRARTIVDAGSAYEATPSGARQLPRRGVQQGLDRFAAGCIDPHESTLGPGDGLNAISWR
jgi:hypothetical protein